MQDQRKKYKVFTRRALILCGAKAALFSILGARFVYLQLINSAKYKMLSDNNRIKLIILSPIRGLITDRNEINIATNQLCYSLVLDKIYVTTIDKAEIIVEQINQILGYQTQIHKIGVRKLINEHPRNKSIFIQDNLSWSDISKIEAASNLQGVEIIQTQKRKYVEANLMCHITGYTARPTQSEVKSSSITNYQEFQVGRNGVEKYFDQQLLGSPGVKKVEVNASGQFMRELTYLPPTTGYTLSLSIDSNIQKIVFKHIKALTGAVVILDPNNGEVIALHSSPTYDPNKFITGIKQDDWEELLSNPGRPLINKAVSVPYPPGSTFKIVTATAILAAGVNPAERIFCSGEHKVGGRIYHCWNKAGHGSVNFEEAVAGSCNIYFYSQAQYVGIDRIAHIAKILGLGEKSNIELPFEHAGLIPDRKWRDTNLTRSWQLGDTINASIGQGYILATPLQLTVMMARLITGLKITPTILRTGEKKMYNNVGLAPELLDKIKRALYKVFNSPYGTGYRNRLVVDGVEISGKTGTAQVVALKHGSLQRSSNKHKDHGLFVGFFPYNNPKYVLSVVIENGGWGSESALPVAKDIIAELLNN